MPTEQEIFSRYKDPRARAYVDHILSEGDALDKLLRGEGVPPDPEEAIRQYKALVEAGKIQPVEEPQTLREMP